MGVTLLNQFSGLAAIALGSECEHLHRFGMSKSQGMKAKDPNIIYRGRVRSSGKFHLLMHLVPSF